jgi:hypothetical protein
MIMRSWRSVIYVAAFTIGCCDDGKNYLAEDALLKVGMTTTEVQAALGDPQLTSESVRFCRAPTAVEWNYQSRERRGCGSPFTHWLCFDKEGKLASHGVGRSTS